MASPYATKTPHKASASDSPESHNRFIAQNTTEATQQIHTEHTTSGKQTQSSKPQTKPQTQYVWKPGHGAIEKIDKRTGDIYHLAEHIQQAA